MFSTTTNTSPVSNLSIRANSIQHSVTSSYYTQSHQYQRNHLQQIHNSYQNLINNPAKHKKDCCQKRKKNYLNSYER